jgi:hypothetical protein
MGEWFCQGIPFPKFFQKNYGGNWADEMLIWLEHSGFLKLYCQHSKFFYSWEYSHPRGHEFV